jgi:hypothetical protein
VIEQKLSTAKLSYAVTGASAAQRFAPVAPARQVAVYVDDIGGAAERLRLRPADAGANVVLAEPFDPVADLLTGPGREPSEGAELLSWMRANEEAWRA